MQVDAIPGEVTVCICTFRRSEVVATIESLARQVVPADLHLRILVIDNDDEPSGRAAVAEASAVCPWPVSYVHAPARNISIARNAALDNAGSRWIAFIDDDETAAPDWIAHLWSAHGKGEAIFGPSLAKYPAGAPRWVEVCDFHSSTLPAKEQALETGYSGNVLLDLDFVRRNQLRFALELGRSGGEDTIFFMLLKQRGGRLHYTEDAVVHEHPGPQRFTMKWVCRRKFRAGQTHALMVLTRQPGGRIGIAARSALKATVSGGAALAHLFDGTRTRWWIARAVFHMGVLSYAVRSGKMAAQY